MPTNDELHRWMQAVATSADKEAFAGLFRYFAPRVKGFLIQGGASADLAEELAQETLVALWRKAKAYDPAKAGLGTWIFAIARNLRIDHFRRGQCRIETVDLDEWDPDALPADAHASPDELVLALQREGRLHRALAALPPEQAMLLRMSFFEEHAHSAIAQRLGMPLGTVKSRIRLAVASLRRSLEGIDP